MTPYIVPQVLRNFPSGLDLTSVPSPNATSEEQTAELFNVCNRATSDVVSYCEQELRATVDVETESGPDWRVTINSQGLVEFRLSRFPVLRLLSASYAPSTVFPRTFIPIPFDRLALKNGVPGEFGTVAPDAAAKGPDTAVIAPGFVTWRGGRGGFVLQVQYLNGWPHCGILAAVLAGDTTLVVDDTTGWVGVVGTIYDGAETEQLLVLASDVPAGPGILTLAAPTRFAHVLPSAVEPLIFSAMPATIQEATVFYAVEQLLVRGSTATTVPALPGAETHTGRDSGDLIERAQNMLYPFKVTVW